MINRKRKDAGLLSCVFFHQMISFVSNYNYNYNHEQQRQQSTTTININININIKININKNKNKNQPSTGNRSRQRQPSTINRQPPTVNGSRQPSTVNRSSQRQRSTVNRQPQQSTATGKLQPSTGAVLFSMTAPAILFNDQSISSFSRTPPTV